MLSFSYFKSISIFFFIKFKIEQNALDFEGSIGYNEIVQKRTKKVTIYA